MALLDFLKNKEDAKKAKKQVEKKPAKASVKKEVKKEAAPKAETTPTPVKTSASSKKSFSYSVIQEPHISEKANDLSQLNKYTFRVYTGANKPEIKKSVEGIYNVDVVDVQTIIVPNKKRRLGKTQGFKKGFTKAIVTIKEGQKIEIF